MVGGDDLQGSLVIQDGNKYWVEEDTRPVIEGFFNLVRRHNQGVAFGIGNGTTWAPVVFLFVLIIALCVIMFFWRRGLSWGRRVGPHRCFWLVFLAT